jgi:hypothetical protein
MNLPLVIRPARLASRGLAVALALLAVVAARAQTTFELTSTAANYATGALDPSSGPASVKGLAGVGSLFSHAGSTSGGITAETFGQTFTATANGSATQAGTGAWLYDGTISGAGIASGTVLPISWNFNLAKNAGITSAVTWTLYFDGDRHGSGANSQIASGTLNYVFGSTSANFTGSANYTYTAAANPGDMFRAYLEVAFTTNNAASQGIVTLTMNNTGFDGGGITLNAAAIPEPSTYAALAGVLALSLAAWRRRCGLA